MGSVASAGGSAKCCTFEMKRLYAATSKASEEPRLPVQVVPSNAEFLSFANHVRRFNR
jgi:hypothetical protein